MVVLLRVVAWCALGLGVLLALAAFVLVDPSYPAGIRVLNALVWLIVGVLVWGALGLISNALARNQRGPLR